MQPTLTWIDLTARDRDQMRRVIDLFSEQGTVDELGLGSLRDTFSNALFPGTSTIQTRLRYVMFVPWIYQRLESKRLDASTFSKRVRQAELDLIEPLLQNEDNDGVIGARARRTLSRLPSSVYWASLVQWGIFKPGQSQSWYHHHVKSLTRAQTEIPRADDPGVIWDRQETWHERLPPCPDDFPRVVSFQLERDEALFLQGRLGETCSGSLLALFAEHGRSDPAEYFWDDPMSFEAPSAIKATVDLARRFSLLVEGGPLLYNLMLAEKRAALNGGDDDAAEHLERYRDSIEQWATLNANEGQFPIEELWAFMARRGTPVKDRQRIFVTAWTHRVQRLKAKHVSDDGELRRLIENRENNLKGARARLQNEGRLLDWNATDGVGLGRMSFRWFRVRQLLKDLHQGLDR